MKKKHLFLKFGVLTASVLLTACASRDEIDELAGVDENGVVKTEFTISFPQQMSGKTRQTTAIVQEPVIPEQAPGFRGLQNIELRPFNISAGSVGTSTNVPSMIRLGDTPDANAGYILTNAEMTNLKATGTNSDQYSKSHLYKNIEIPIGTRSFMFYGVAKDNETGTGSHNIVNGALEKNETGANGTLADIEISPVQIYGTGTVDQQGSDIAEYLTGIATASATIDGGSKTTLYYFPNFTTISAGSWNSAKAVVTQLYKSVYNLAEYDTDGKVTNIANNLYSAIVNAITKQYTFGTGETARNVTFVTAEGKGTDNKRNGTLTFTEDYSYPQNIGLPDGAAYVKWNTTGHPNVFWALTNDNFGTEIATLDTYVYPASLYYFGLSDIKTAGTTMEDVYKSTKTWQDILNAYDAASVEGKGTVVQSTTRSIAIVKEVQYAVGRLDVTVKTKSGAPALKDADGNSVTVGTNFPITGIIVGNQRVVDYQFDTKDKTATADQYAIYDSQVTENNPILYIGSEPSYKTHTLVLQSADATSEDDPNANIPIAVEFENTSTATIVGKDKVLIYPNTKFYLVGTLKPFNNTTQHYDSDGTKPLIKKAFVQDYVTTANFEVSSLANAYNMLPDLRTPHLEIGLSVDLNWKTGITQTIDIP